MANRIGALALGVVVTVGALAGCAGQQDRPKGTATPGTIQSYVEEGKAPKWVTQKGAAFSGDRAVFYGVGNTAGLVNPSLKRKAAEAAARRDLAQEFQVYIAALEKQYLAETSARALEHQSVEQHIEDVMKQLTEQTLLGSSIVEYWEHPDRNEAYALARLDLGRFQDMTQKLKSNEEKFKELDAKLKETIKQNAENLHRELAAELEKKNQQK